VFEDLTRLAENLELSRRQFVVTTLTTGFALAVQPVSAQTITTDAEGLVAGEVKIPVADGEIPAYPPRSSCKRYSASTSTSKTFAAASPS
jgi:hypothetical protein